MSDRGRSYSEHSLTVSSVHLQQLHHHRHHHPRCRPQLPEQLTSEHDAVVMHISAHFHIIQQRIKLLDYVSVVNAILTRIAQFYSCDLSEFVVIFVGFVVFYDYPITSCTGYSFVLSSIV